MNVYAGVLFLTISLALLRPVPAQPAAKACVNPTCASPPCAALLRGDVGCTSVAGTATITSDRIKKGDTIASKAHIYGPFEAGFGVQQKSIIEGWGCTDASLAYDAAGGLDLGIATAKVAYKCSIELPRSVNGVYYGIVGECGGHTSDYHFHTRMTCLYSASGAHSTAVGDVAQWKLYGKWEDFTNNKMPLLDACGGHFGPTPDSNGAKVYHYHVQDTAPFIVGCHGPTADNKLVGVAACRALYTSCKNAEAEDIKTGANTIVSYDRDCPCWDADSKNTGTIKELPALSSTEISYTDGASSATTASGSATTGTSGSTTGGTTGGTTGSTTGTPTAASGVGQPGLLTGVAAMMVSQLI